jgi:hypothetical protein
MSTAWRSSPAAAKASPTTWRTRPPSPGWSGSSWPAARRQVRQTTSSPAARPCRMPGLPAALAEVMLSDLPPSPAAASTPGRFGICLRRVEDVWRPEVSIEMQPYQGRAPRPARAAEQRSKTACRSLWPVRVVEVGELRRRRGARGHRRGGRDDRGTRRRVRLLRLAPAAESTAPSGLPPILLPAGGTVLSSVKER